jgi:hypothetical protein
MRVVPARARADAADMATRSGQDGQASVEYVGVIALVALILAVGAAIITFTGLGERVIHTIRQGLCQVAGFACPVPPKPCIVRRNAERDTGSVTVGIVRVGSDAAVIRELRSDGRVLVTLIGGSHGGAEIGIGAGGEIVAGGAPLPAGGEARAAAIVHLGGGRQWVLRSQAEADRLVDDLGQDETIPILDGPAEVIDEALGGGTEVRKPDVEWVEGGPGGEASAAIGAGLSVSASASMGQVEGTRFDHRTGARTLYLRLDSTGSAAISAKLVGASVTSPGTTSVALTFDRHGKPVELSASATRALEGTVGLPPGLRALIAQSAGGATPGPGARVEVDARLDLTAPANVEAARRLMQALGHPDDLGGVVSAVKGIGERIVDGARLEARLYGTTGHNYGGGGRVRLGGGIGGHVLHRTEDNRLLGAWERPPDGTWLQRRDCLDAARRLAA